MRCVVCVRCLFLFLFFSFWLTEVPVNNIKWFWIVSSNLLLFFFKRKCSCIHFPIYIWIHVVICYIHTWFGTISKTLLSPLHRLLAFRALVSFWTNPKISLWIFITKIEQWLRLRTRLYCSVSRWKTRCTLSGKTVTLKSYRQNKYAGTFNYSSFLPCPAYYNL